MACQKHRYRYLKRHCSAHIGVTLSFVSWTGLLNPNRRHDDPEEKRMDMIRAEINASHRFHSFAGERSHNFVKWSVLQFRRTYTIS